MDLNKDNLQESSLLQTLADTLDHLNKIVQSGSKPIELSEFPQILNIISEMKNQYKELKEIELYDDILLVNKVKEDVEKFLSDFKSKIDNGFFDGKNGTNGTNGTDGQDGTNGKDGTNGVDGQNGKSVYQIWQELGNSGTEQNFINSLKGSDGQDGTNGLDGQNGKSAYQTWKDLGNSGTEQDFINFLKGSDGQNGTDGTNGLDGQNGKSAYQTWKDLGNSGSEQDFINFLKSSYTKNLEEFKTSVNTALAEKVTEDEVEAKINEILSKKPDISDTGWKDLKPYLVNNWMAMDDNKYPIKYRKIGDIVFFKGLVSSGTSSLIFYNLPEEIRPTTDLFISAFATYSNVANKTFSRVYRSGSVESDSYSTTWTSINCSYLVS